MAPASSAPAAPARIGVVGLGDVGGALAPLIVGAGHPLVLVSRRSRAELASALDDLVDRPGVVVLPADDAAAQVDIVLLTVPYRVARETLSALGDLTGKIVVDATNYNRDRDGDALDPGPDGTTAVLRRGFPTAVWVKAFNMLWAGWLRSDADVRTPSRVVFVAADDAGAKAVVAGLIHETGFVPFDTGTLDEATSRQLEGTPAWNQRLTAADAVALMPDAPGPITVPA